MENIEYYNKRAVCCSLIDFDQAFADESDFIEL